jgi:uncharacterized protein YjaG (DUF416 family)
MAATYDEDKLREALSRLSDAKVLAFATSAATRQRRNYESFVSATGLGKALQYDEILRQLWAASAAPLTNSGWPAILDEIMASLDEALEQTEKHWLHAALADDALASLAYAVGYLLARDPQEAVWSSRRAYEIADQVAIAKQSLALGSAESEQALLNDVIVQRELGRQARDLIILQGADDRTAITELETLAWSEMLLTDEELLTIPEWQARR